MDYITKTKEAQDKHDQEIKKLQSEMKSKGQQAIQDMDKLKEEMRQKQRRFDKKIKEE